MTANKTIKPRSLTNASIPGMLATFQNEWDEIMLEVFTLKQHLDSTRRELSQALYQHDAACRVIARLMRERDEARAMLISGQEQAISSSHASSSSSANGSNARESTAGEMEVEPILAENSNVHKDGSWSASLGQISAKSLELQEMRKQRPKKIPETTRSRASLSEISNTTTSTPHKASPAGITCVAVQGGADSIILTGGVDKELHLLSQSTGKAIAKIPDAHSKKVQCVAFHGNSTTGMILSGSADKTVKLWKASDNRKSYTQAAVFEHEEAVAAICQHPWSQLACSFSADGAFACLDLERQVTALRIAEKKVSDYSYLCGAVHPDAIMLAGGTNTGVLKVWDIRQATIAVNLTDHSANGLTALDFSNNGYYVCTGDAAGVLRLWDLRKITCLHTETVSTSAISSIAFDNYGLYAAVGGCGNGCGVQLWQVKDWEQIKNLEDAHSKAVTGVAWGPNASFVASVGMDRCVKVFA